MRCFLCMLPVLHLCRNIPAFAKIFLSLFDKLLYNTNSAFTPTQEVEI